MDAKNILKTIGKNFLAFLVGGILGILSTLIIVPIALRSSLEGQSGIGAIGAAIVLGPVLVIIYGILGLFIGGILGISVYNLIRYYKNKK